MPTISKIIYKTHQDSCEIRRQQTTVMVRKPLPKISRSTPDVAIPSNFPNKSHACMLNGLWPPG